MVQELAPELTTNVLAGYAAERGPLRHWARYPRLLSAACWQASLSRGEAASLVDAYRRGDEYCCEAVAAYGGTSRVLADVVQRRQGIRAGFGAYWSRGQGGT